MKKESGQDNKVCATENHGDDDVRGWIAVRKVIIKQQDLDFASFNKNSNAGKTGICGVSDFM